MVRNRLGAMFIRPGQGRAATRAAAAAAALGRAPKTNAPQQDITRIACGYNNQAQHNICLHNLTLCSAATNPHPALAAYAQKNIAPRARPKARARP